MTQTELTPAAEQPSDFPARGGNQRLCRAEPWEQQRMDPRPGWASPPLPPRRVEAKSCEMVEFLTVCLRQGFLLLLLKAFVVLGARNLQLPSPPPYLFSLSSPVRGISPVPGRFPVPQAASRGPRAGFRARSEETDTNSRLGAGVTCQLAPSFLSVWNVVWCRGHCRLC